MSKLLIKGGRPLRGETEIKAAKNAVLPILAATLLTEEPCEIHNVPVIADVDNMLKILRSVGSAVEFIRSDPREASSGDRRLPGRV